MKISFTKKIIIFNLIVDLALIINAGYVMYKTGYRDGKSTNLIYTEPILNECPLCGNNKVELIKVHDSWYIECTEYDDDLNKIGCGLHTGYYKDQYDLINKWNNMEHKNE